MNCAVAGAELSIGTTTSDNFAVLIPSMPTSIPHLCCNPNLGTFPVWVHSCVNLLVECKPWAGAMRRLTYHRLKLKVIFLAMWQRSRKIIKQLPDVPKNGMAIIKLSN
jgi:hypothetical protein